MVNIVVSLGERNTNIYHCEWMFSFRVMVAQLNFALDIFLHCYSPLTHQWIWHGVTTKDTIDKDPMDGIGGTLRNSVYHDVVSEKCIIGTPKQFAEYAERSVNGITSLYLPTEEVLKEPEDIESSRRIAATLQIHVVKRFFDNRKVCVLEFYHLTNDSEPYFTQFYGQGGCGHQNNALGENPCRSCGKDYLPNEEWLQCPICKVWLDRQCFYLWKWRLVNFSSFFCKFNYVLDLLNSDVSIERYLIKACFFKIMSDGK